MDWNERWRKHASVLGYQASRERELRPMSHRRMHFPPHFARRLVRTAELPGHNGCVNRLAWNDTGSLLASGSDDLQVMLWRHPQISKPPLCLHTRHELNIFGVDFLPQSQDTKVVTCSYDRMVQLHNLERAVGTSVNRRLTLEALNTLDRDDCQTTIYPSHSESVKDVAVVPGEPNCFWSAGEDGRVHQYDIRNAADREPLAPNMLISAPWGRRGQKVQFRSLDVNKQRPWMMATACSDRFVRVYDRRRLSLRPSSNNFPSQPLLAMAPLHMAMGTTTRSTQTVSTTCARFSNKGDQLVATYYTEQAYSFDVLHAEAPPKLAFCCYKPSMKALGAAALKDERDGPFNGCLHEVHLDNHHMMLRARANRCVFDNLWHEALELYNQLLRELPWFSQGYAARAIVLLHRGWRGDAVCALRDADTCVALSPNWPKAYETRIRCLRKLGQYQTAMSELEMLVAEFPDEARPLAELRKQLEKSLDERRRRGQDTPPGVQQSSSRSVAHGRVNEAGRCFRECLRMSHTCKPAPGPSASGDSPAQLRASLRATWGCWLRGRPADIPHDALPPRSQSRSPAASRPSATTDKDAMATSSQAAAASPPATPPVTQCVRCDSPGAQQPLFLRQQAPPAKPAAAPAPPCSGPLGYTAPGSSAPSGSSMIRDSSAASLTPVDTAQSAESELFHRLADAADRPDAAHPRPPATDGDPSDPDGGAVPAAASGASSATSRSDVDSSADAGRAAATRDAAAELLHVVTRGAGLQMQQGSLRAQLVLRPGNIGTILIDPVPGAQRRARPNDGDAVAARDGERNVEPRWQDSAELCAYLYGQVPWRSCGDDLQPPDGLAHVCCGSQLEALVSHSMRMKQAYIGQCNARTNIKEATFVGAADSVVACGSDRGTVLLFDAETGDLLRVLWADREVANCVQCHPTLPVLATSGLDYVVRLWEPNWDSDATRLGSDHAELRQLQAQNQVDMESEHGVFEADVLGPPGVFDLALSGPQCNPS